MTTTHSAIYLTESIEIVASELRVRCNGQDKHLRKQAIDVLLYLVEQQHRPVGREELIERVWHGAAVTDDSIGQCISEIREVLGDSSRKPQFIRTLPKVGYQFIGQTRKELPHTVGTSSGTELPASEAHTYEPAAVPIHEPKFDPVRHPRKADSGWLKYCLTAVALSGIAWRVWHGWSPIHRQPAPVLVRGNSRPSIAVLRFDNLSGRPGDAWLSTALCDWFGTELAAGEQLRTVTPETVTEKRTGLSLPTAGELGTSDLNRIHRDLGVNLVLIGSYAILSPDENSPVRVDLRVEDARTKDTIVATSATGNVAHLFDLVSVAGKALRAKLAVPEVTDKQAEEVAASLPSDPAATKVYAEGLDKLRIYDFPAARDLLQKAVAIAPKDPMPHAALASAWEQLGYDSKAEFEAKQALNLSSHLSRADRLLIEANYHEAARDWSGAMRTYSALFSFFPDDLHYGLALANAQIIGGRWTEALATLATLRQLPSPLRDDPRIDWQECRAKRSLGDIRQALTFCARSEEKARIAGATLLQARALIDEAKTLSNIDDSERAPDLVQNAKKLFIAIQDQEGVAAATNSLAAIAERHGDYLEAEKGYKEALVVDQRIEYQPGIAAMHNNLGGIEFELGDPRGALKQFEDALTTYQKIEEEDGMALAKNGLGGVYLAVGEHEEAKANYQDSMNLCRQIGDRSRGADALEGLSTALWIEGDLRAALQTVTEAKATFEQLGEKSKSLGLDTELANILLDQGRATEAINVSRNTIAALQQSNAVADSADIYLVLINALLSGHRITDAQNAFAEVQRLTSNIHNRVFSWSIEITAARLKASSGEKNNVSEAERQLKTVSTQAMSAGFVNIALKARLELAEMEIAYGNSEMGRRNLSALKESSEDKFPLIAHKASAQLAALQSGSAH